ncbi:MAG: hypothetical protein ABIH42_00045 [Planctomycetota bacterium]
MKSKLNIIILLLMFFAVIVTFETALAQESPEEKENPPEAKADTEKPDHTPPPTDEEIKNLPAPPTREEQAILERKQLHQPGEEKEDTFTCREEPGYKIVKPDMKKWHFLDMSKLLAKDLDREKDSEKRQSIEALYRVLRFIMYNEDTNAIAKVTIYPQEKDKDLKTIVLEIESSLQNNVKNFKVLTKKEKQKSGAFGALVEFEEGEGKAESRHVLYVFIKNNNVYQLQMSCTKDKFEQSEKDFDKIYNKWKF